MKRFPWPFVITYENETGKSIVWGLEGECVEVCATREDAEARARHEIEIMRCLGDIE